MSAEESSIEHWSAVKISGLFCPVCKKDEFVEEKAGFPLKADGLRCPSCGTLLQVKAGRASPVYRVAAVGKSYSNAAYQVKVSDWTGFEPGNIDQAFYSDEKLLELGRGAIDPEFLAGNEDCAVPFPTGPGETVVFILENIYQWEERPKSDQQAAGSRTFQVRPGGWEKIGALGEPKAFNHIETLEHGTLYITDRRYVLVGKKRRIDEELYRIKAVYPFKNGIGVVRNEKMRIEYLKGAYYWPLVGAVLSGLAYLRRKEHAAPKTE